MLTAFRPVRHLVSLLLDLLNTWAAESNPFFRQLKGDGLSLSLSHSLSLCFFFCSQLRNNCLFIPHSSTNIIEVFISWLLGSWSTSALLLIAYLQKVQVLLGKTGGAFFGYVGARLIHSGFWFLIYLLLLYIICIICSFLNFFV